MNAAALISLYRLKSEDDLIPPHFSDAECLASLNEATEEACKRSNLLFDDTTAAICTIAVTATTARYDKSELITVITTAHFDNEPLYIVDRDELDRTYSGWRTDTGTPRYIIVDDDKVQLVPNPTSDGTLTFGVYRLPLEEITTGAPEIAAKHHKHLVDFILKRSYEKRDSDTNAIDFAKYHEAEFVKYFGEEPTVNQKRFSRSTRHHSNKSW